MSTIRDILSSFGIDKDDIAAVIKLIGTTSDKVKIIDIVMGEIGECGYELETQEMILEELNNKL